MPFAVASLLLFFLALPAGAANGDEQTGVVRGQVTVLKKKLFGRVGPGESAAGVLVYVTGYTETAPDEVAVLGQQNERFEPRVLPIVAGQTVKFLNGDRFYHNVFSVGPTAPFDLGQYKSTDQPRTHKFSTPGLVPVYCNIHPEMLAYVVVLENRPFAMTDADGRFELHDVRAGPITVNAWAPGAQRVAKETTLAAGDEVSIDFDVVQQAIPAHKRKDGSDYPPASSSDYPAE